MIYGAGSSVAPNPIEKKPFYHYCPGTMTFTVGSWSCNFGCPWCQNWSISRVPPPGDGEFLDPDRFVQWTENAGCQGISISFNEPTLSLEWSIDVFKLSRERGLYNAFVTNGYLTPEALSLLIEAGLDAMNVDIKGDAPGVRQFCKGIDIEKVWATCKLAVAGGIHLEITTLVVPSVNDTDAILKGIAERIASELGPDIPWHVSAYFPAFQFASPRTPIRSLLRAWEIGKGAGLDYVYLGNLPGHKYDNTYCPDCGLMLIRRLGYQVLSNIIDRGKCPQCGREISGVWSLDQVSVSATARSR